MKKGELTAFEAGLKFPCKPILVVSNRKGILLTVKIAAAVGYCVLHDVSSAKLELYFEWNIIHAFPVSFRSL